MPGVELATAYISLVPSLQGAQGAIAEQFGAEGEEASGRFGDAWAVGMGAIVAVAAAAAVAAGAMFATGFSEAAEAEVATAQLNAAIVSTGNAANVSVDGLSDLASEIQGYSGQTDDSIAATESLLLRFQNIKNVGVDDIFNQATKAAADMAARLGGDAASQAQKLGRALEDPIAGLTSLARSGVVFTDQQKAQVEAMVAAGDTLGAQKIILAQVNAAYGGSAAAFGGTWTGTVERVKRSFEDFTQAAVENLLPLFKPALEGVVGLLERLTPAAEVFGDMLSSGVGKAMEFLGPIFGQIAAVVGPLAAQFFELWTTISPLSIVFQAIQPFLPQLLDAFLNLATVVGGALGQAFITLMPAMQQLAGVLIGVLGQAISIILPIIVQLVNILGPVIATVLTALMPVIIQLAGIVGQLFQAFLPLLEPILSLIAPIAELVAALLPPLIDLFVGLLGPILALISPLLDLLIPVLQVVIGVLAFIVTGVVEVITWFVKLITGSEDAGNQLNAVWSAVLSFFGAIWDGIVGFFKTGIDNVMGFVTGLRDKVVNVLRDAGTWLLDAGKAIIRGFIEGIQSMIGAVGDAVGGVMDFVAGFFPHSPAERGPFSGRGWTDLRQSGLAIADQFNSGLESAQLGVAFEAFTVPTSTASADLLGDDELAGVRASDEPRVLDLSDSTIDKIARAIAALLRNLLRQGGVTSG